MEEVVKNKSNLDLLKFIEKMASMRVDRLMFQHYTEGDYFDKYPDRKEMIIGSFKRDAQSFIHMSPEVLVMLHSLKSKAEEKNTNSDSLLKEDIEYILRMSGAEESQKPPKTLQVKDDIYTVIQLIMATRCCAGMRTEGYILDGSKHINELILGSDPETVQKAYIVASKIDRQSFPKRDLAPSFHLATFRACGLDHEKSERILPKKLETINPADYPDPGF